MLALDTNVLVRYLVADNPRQFPVGLADEITDDRGFDQVSRSRGNAFLFGLPE